jgi:DNA-binding response OmpR family regulator
MTISVLICDDLASVQGMMRRMLERDGLIAAGVAGSADEVLARYQECRPDIVLLDYRMPGANGFSVLRALLARDPEACIVMCSGVDDPEVRHAALALGAADWVVKPIYPTSLVASLRELVARKKFRAESKPVRHSTAPLRSQY